MSALPHGPLDESDVGEPPGHRPRHRKDVTATADFRPLGPDPGPGRSLSALDDTIGHLAAGGTLPASYVTDLVATRPQGGKRRAPTSTATPGKRDRARQATGGKRASSDNTTGVLVDATDAAGHLAMASFFWDATQILAHAEIAKMALAEALASLSEERDVIEDERWSLKKRRALADIQRRAADLLRAHRLLSEAHAKNLVVGD